MRDEMGNSIRLTDSDLVSVWYPIFPPVGFSDWRPALLFPHTKRRIVTADFNGTNRFSCFLSLLGQEHMVWKLGKRTAKLAPQRPTNPNFLKMISP